MRLPRVRSTVRRMMALIALVALVLGVSVEAIRLKRARSEFLTRFLTPFLGYQFSSTTRVVAIRASGVACGRGGGG